MRTLAAHLIANGDMIRLRLPRPDDEPWKVSSAGVSRMRETHILLQLSRSSGTEICTVELKRNAIVMTSDPDECAPATTIGPKWRIEPLDVDYRTILLQLIGSFIVSGKSGDMKLSIQTALKRIGMDIRWDDVSDLRLALAAVGVTTLDGEPLREDA